MDTALNPDGKKMYFLSAWDCTCTVWDNYISYGDELLSTDNPDDHWKYYNTEYITYNTTK